MISINKRFKKFVNDNFYNFGREKFTLTDDEQYINLGIVLYTIVAIIVFLCYCCNCHLFGL